jgi:hypothetical protein
VERNFSSFYCDCGAGEGVHACQCLDFEKAKEIIKTETKTQTGVIVRTLTKEQLKQFYNPTGENFSMDEEEEEEELKTPTPTTTTTTTTSGNRVVTNDQLMNALLQTSTPTTPSSTNNTTTSTTTTTGQSPITQEHLNSFFNQFNNQNNQ